MTKEALKLALEALEADYLAMVADGNGHMVYLEDQAITAIKEALAQPEQERVAPTCERCADEIVENNAGLCANCLPAICTEHEPVASYLPEMSIPNFSARVAWGAPDHIDLRNGWRPLYTTPPQRTWVGLTDEQRINISYKADGNECVAVELTEVKLKELNT